MGPAGAALAALTLRALAGADHWGQLALKAPRPQAGPPGLWTGPSGASCSEAAGTLPGLQSKKIKSVKQKIEQTEEVIKSGLFLDISKKLKAKKNQAKKN